jgi:hypothetical protein
MYFYRKASEFIYEEQNALLVRGIVFEAMQIHTGNQRLKCGFMVIYN